MEPEAGTHHEGEDRIVIMEAAALSLCSEILQALGVAKPDADLTADVFVQAEAMAEESHGLRLFLQVLERIEVGGDRAVTDIVAVLDRGAIGVWDAQRSIGQVTAARAMDHAMSKARDHGIGLVSVRNGNSLTSARYYALRAAAKGMIGLVYSNTSRRLMPPPGGKAPVLGSNPFAAAAPAGRFGAFVLDMSCTTAAVERILRAREVGETIPEGWALDINGQPTTDPGQALESMALLPFGGPKAFGLGMVHEIMTSVLNGGLLFAGDSTGFRPPEGPMNTAFTQLAIDISAFQPLSVFEARMEEFLATIKAAEPLSPGLLPRIPGERSLATLATRRADGIPLVRDTYRALQNWAKKVGVAISDPVHRKPGA